VFLVGDAADAWPPTGGLGANTGIQDAHNLAWKLAAVVKGTAGAALLDTHDQERRPIGLLIMGQAMARFASRMAPGQARRCSTTAPSPSATSTALGHAGRHRPRPAAAAPGPPDRPARLPRPHLQVTVDHRQISTLDLYGRGFCAPGRRRRGRVDGGRGQPPGAGGRLPLRGGAHPRRRGGRPRHRVRGALLVRPDGFVAWRSIGRPPTTTELGGVLRAMLSTPS
jgi:putative polyketide hydroxylase